MRIQEYAKSSIANKYASFAATARRYGIKIGIFYALTAQIDYTLPLILTSMGHPELGLTLFAPPISSTATASYMLGTKAMKYHHLVRQLGGFNVTIHHLNIFKQVKAYFGEHIFGKYDLINLNMSGINHVLTVERPGFLNKFMRALGQDKSINYVGMLTLMQEKYSKYINQMPSASNLQIQRQWIIRTSNATNFIQLYAQMTRIPDGIPPKTLDKLWREFILVNASKKIENYASKTYYKAFRKLFEVYDRELRITLVNDASDSVNNKIRSQFKDYIFNALPPINRCELDYIRLPNKSNNSQ